VAKLHPFELRTFQFSDAEQLADFHVRNRDFFSAFSASREPSYYTVDYQRQFIQQYISDHYEDTRYAFGIFDQATGSLIGIVSLSDVVRGPLQSGYLGYCIDKSFNNLGIGKAVVRQILQIAFHNLQLHRIEAHVMPGNAASRRVLEHNGFVQEGVCRKNIKVNGLWEDHILYARLSTDGVGE
jgi:ribosomal-protein-alanine N-acetyltransferase